MPASQPQAITEVAKPVRVSAAMRAHLAFCAVMMRRVPRIGKASAKVASIATPLMFMEKCSSRSVEVDGFDLVQSRKQSRRGQRAIRGVEGKPARLVAQPDLPGALGEVERALLRHFPRSFRG